MFDKLDDLLARYESVLEQLSDPDILNNQEKYTSLMKEQSDLAPIAAKYKEYLAAKQAIEHSLAMLDEEKDEEMRELAKEELNESKAATARIEGE